MKIHRVAVVSDIHANIYALRVFMDYLNMRPEIDTVLNLGDFLQYGPNPVEVYDIVMNDHRFINILGNNEIELFDDLNDEENDEWTKHKVWTKKALGEERIDRLKSIPKSKLVNLYGNKLFLVHTVTEQSINMDELSQCHYVLMGHTHQQSFGSYWKEKRVVNPGSVGYTPKGIVNFAVMEIGGEMINFAFKNMQYNILKSIRDLDKSDIPGSEKIINYLMQGDD